MLKNGINCIDFLGIHFAILSHWKCIFTHKIGGIMKIAVPMEDGKPCMHSSRCENYAILNVNLENKDILSKPCNDPPSREPGVLPSWLAEKGVDIVIAGDMGQRALSLFQSNNIKVIVSAPGSEIESLLHMLME